MINAEKWLVEISHGQSFTVLPNIEMLVYIKRIQADVILSLGDDCVKKSNEILNHLDVYQEITLCRK